MKAIYRKLFRKINEYNNRLNPQRFYCGIPNEQDLKDIEAGLYNPVIKIVLDKD